MNWCNYFDFTKIFWYNIYLKSKKEIINIAQRIIKLESSLDKNGQTNEAINEIFKIASSLDLEDMIAVDNYIQEHFQKWKTFDIMKIFWYNIYSK